MRQKIFRFPQNPSAIDAFLIPLLSFWTDLTHYFGVSFVDFEQVNLSWESFIFFKTYIINKQVKFKTESKK